MIIVISVFLSYILSDIDISTRDFFWLQFASIVFPHLSVFNISVQLCIQFITSEYWFLVGGWVLFQLLYKIF